MSDWLYGSRFGLVAVVYILCMPLLLVMPLPVAIGVGLLVAWGVETLYEELR